MKNTEAAPAISSAPASTSIFIYEPPTSPSNTPPIEAATI